MHPGSVHFAVSDSFRQVFLVHRQRSDPFLTFYDVDGQRSVLSYRSFFQLCDRIQNGLESMGILPLSSRIVVAMDNSPELVALICACLDFGVTVCPINPRESIETISDFANRVSAQLIVGQKPMPTKAFMDFASLLNVKGAEHDHQERAIVPSSHLAALFQTSGSTSNSKVVCLSHDAILTNCAALLKHHGWNQNHIHFCVLPIYHVNAFGFSLLTTLLAGGRLVLCERFPKNQFWEYVVAESCGSVSLVPELIRRITEAKSQPDMAKIDKHFYCVSAASPLPGALSRRFTERFGIRIFQGYGLSETVNFSLMTPLDLSDGEYEMVHHKFDRPSAGTPVTGVEVKVVDPINLRDCAVSETGEIVIRGRSIMQGYLGNMAANEFAFRTGWFHTGDLGFWFTGPRQVTYFCITGRIKETIKRNGEGISLDEIDDYIQRSIPGLEVASIGFPNDITGEEIGLVVVGAGREFQSGVEAMLAKIPFFKRPKVIVEVSGISRTESHKIRRRDMVCHFAPFASEKFRDGKLIYVNRHES